MKAAPQMRTCRLGMIAFFSVQLLGSCSQATTIQPGVCCSAELVDPSKLQHANLPGAPVDQMTWTLDYDSAQPIDLSQLLRAGSPAPLTWTINAADLNGSLLHVTSPPADDKVAVYNVQVRRPNETRSDYLRLILLPSTTHKRFTEWYEHERKDMAWLSLLPPAYSSLGPEMSNPEPKNCPSRYWEDVHKLSSQFHPGGAYEIRSRPVQGGHGHQAVYDSHGSLITEGPGAGSADKHAPTFSGLARHRDEDVRPYVWAAQLDGNPVDPTLFFRNLNAPLLRQGAHITEYLSVRPPLWGANPKVSPGVCIASK